MIVRGFNFENTSEAFVMHSVHLRELCWHEQETIHSIDENGLYY